jgi:septum formation protein
MSSPRLILASNSPRRRELLQEMGLAFEVVVADVRELDAASSPELPPAELAMENARLKAVAGAALRPGCWILGADTVVALEGRLFGKPANLARAADCLRALSGRTHEVITGCTLIDPAGTKTLFHDVSRVTFRPLNDENIAEYLAQVHVLDKAGAYALQERGDLIVACVAGSRTNVIGLPTEKLALLLAQRGYIQDAAAHALEPSS